MLQIRPIETYPRPFTSPRKSAPFSAKLWQTEDLIDREMYQLKAKNVVLQLYVPAFAIRIDGTLRADAVPTSPAVILSFETPVRSVQMPCDKYFKWEHNLRAIGLTLEALRKIDRYGVSQTGEQYAGWTRLGNGDGTLFASREAARQFLDRLIGSPVAELPPATARRRSEMKSHPDTGGSAELFKATRKALEMLGL